MVFCWHAYSTDLIGHIHKTSEPQTKKVTLIGPIGIFQKLEQMIRKEKTKTKLSFHFTDKESMPR